MRELSDFQAQDIRRLIEQEGWNEPLAEVERVHLSRGQQAVFWGLRVYVVIMTGLVVWAFVHGTG